MSRPASVAVLSMACRLPDASSPAQLWDNLVEGRRSFRAVPSERLDIRRYAAEAIGEAESITPIRAGLLTNWQVDLRSLRIPRKTFLGVDLTHWLALELSVEVLESIGGPDRLDRTQTAVIVANTLTGEFSRAGQLRLRLPFLDDVLAEASNRENVPPDLAARLRDSFAAALRRHFPEPNEESLAGGLANTIAGRIANYFNFRGGAYAVDGACASSLVALADAATLLLTQQADAVVVAAVDLSLDPFELVGFSRNGVLAADEMRVFDARASGFWPGEGGACLLLMREEDAMRRELPIMARLRGWGLSSDGAGGLTRPSSDGQLAAYHRAYVMAAADPADVAFVEAHGTGTAVGDPVEVRALAALREGAKASLPIGSIKANIGHTKAAAGLAGIVKAIAALRHGVIPPHVSCDRPHVVFEQVDNKIRPVLAAEPIDDGKAVLAGVSSFGFGGINAHVVLERIVPDRAGTPARPIAVPRLPAAQDAELFVVSGDSADAVRDDIALLEGRAAMLSMAELVDAAAHAARTLQPGAIRVAVIAASGIELAERLARAKAAVTADASLEDLQDGVFVGRPSRPLRLGFVFPGQGASYRPDGGLWRRRFATAASLFERLPAVASRDPADTAIAQPSIMAASLSALDILDRLGVSAGVAAGHSLGEITALVWAGALAGDSALDLAKTRGSLMARFGAPNGAMLRVALPPADAASIADESGSVIACCNGKAETVLSGSADAIAAADARCQSHGVETSKLAVSHAFHSPHMADAADALAEALGAVRFGPVAKQIVSTVGGGLLAPRSDLRKLLVEQMTKPVLFDAALAHLAAATDYVVEVGPGFGLTRLARADSMAALSVDAFSDSIKPLLTTVGALFAAGLDIHAKILFDDRPVRDFSPGAIPHFIASPCGSQDSASQPRRPMSAPPIAAEAAIADRPSPQSDPLAVTLQAVAHETGLDPDGIDADLRFLDSLHLNSLAVTRIVTAAARTLGLRAPVMPTDFANATARQVAKVLAELRTFPGDAAEREHRIVGVRPWVRTYAMQWRKGEARPSGATTIRWFDMTTAQQIPAAADDDRSGLLIRLDDPFATVAAERLVAIVAEAARRKIGHLALCHDGAPVAGLARSIAREACFRSVRVIDRMAAATRDPSEFDARLTAVLSADISGYYEARLSDDGGFEKPIFLPQRVNASPFAAITPNDVVVVVGGGKGIAAECALRLASRGAAIVLLGRSAPDEPTVAATLVRARQKGLRCSYVRADVLEARSLHAGLGALDPSYGKPTALIYAAAVNEPKRLIDLDPDTLRQTLALKTTGLEMTLAALPSVRRLITFGSIIGRIGFEGEAHYALANAMQSAATEAWAAAAPNRAALAIEWSVWGGMGMGETLGTIERLSAQGVDAISVDDALAAFDHLMARNAVGTVAVTSRFGPPPDVSLGSSELPMARFIDEPKVHFPGVELIVETTLTQARDLYLDDHVVSGLAVMPLVMGLEAMAQVAGALVPLGPRIAVGHVVLSRAVGVPQAGATRIRIAALHHQRRTIDVHLLTEDDGFAAPCMQASFSVATADLVDLPDVTPATVECAADSLYGPLLFHSGRFRRLETFETITSRCVAARLRPDGETRWFSAYEPGALVLWDPGATDAALHALQVAIPHWRVLPVGAERIEIDATVGPLTTIRAIERRTAKRSYTFDVVVSDATGRVGQRWTDVTFRAVDKINIRNILASAPALAMSYLERAAREALGDDTIEVSFIRRTDQSREARRGAAIRRLGLRGTIDRRGDGRPIGDGGSLSIAHRGDATLVIAARESAVGCDIEDAAADEADNDERRRHAVLEVSRKLGRRTPAGAACTIIPGTPARIGDLTVVTFDVPLASGSYIVAFGRSHAAAAAFLSGNYEVGS